jgi:hypothetical protein
MVAELPIAIAAMTHPEQVPSLVSGVVVRAVSLSVVIPDVALEAVRRDFAMAPR